MYNNNFSFSFFVYFFLFFLLRDRSDSASCFRFVFFYASFSFTALRGGKNSGVSGSKADDRPLNEHKWVGEFCMKNMVSQQDSNVKDFLCKIPVW